MRRVRSKRYLSNRGVALITAMLITALAGIVAGNLVWDNALDVRRTMSLLNRDQAVQVALGAESWIKEILRQDFQDDPSKDHLGELWASDLPGLPIEGGEVFGVIEDLQGRFNINNLIDQNGRIHSESLEQFRRLLLSLSIDPRFAGIAADWLDSDQQASFPDGAEDAIYTSRIPAYKTPNLTLTSISELAAIEGMDRQVFKHLAPHITALPERTRINVNTATAAVLQSLDDRISVSDVESWLSEREQEGFNSIQTSFSSLVTRDVINNTLDESTRYFQLKVVVRIDTVRITLYSTLLRGPQGDVAAILRSLGTL